MKKGSGESLAALGSCAGGAAKIAVVGGEAELSLVAVLLGQKLNLGRLSSGLELLGFGVLGFNVADEILGCVIVVSGVGSPNVLSFSNGFGLEDAVPNGRFGMMLAGFFAESTSSLEGGS